jgi:hypothetical protein
MAKNIIYRFITHIGNLGNILGTQREFSGNQGKIKKKNWEPK